jgi:GntR family transcriptional regulator
MRMAAEFLFRVLPNSGLPIYRQLVEQVRRHVASGRFKADDFLPSVRQVALELDINAMTVSKAYSLLEREGVLELVRGQGMRVADRNDAAASVAERQAQILPLAQQLAAEAQQLSLTDRQVKAVFDRAIKERDAP